MPKMKMEEFNKCFVKALETKPYVNIATTEGIIRHIDDIKVFSIREKNELTIWLTLYSSNQVMDTIKLNDVMEVV